MGQFPYYCESCGGAYSRCALRDQGDRGHIRCEGGQFCWEDNVVLYVNGKKYDNCSYSGYGEVYTEDNESYSVKNGNDGVIYYEEPDDPQKKLKVKVYCKSCIYGRPPVISDEEADIDTLLKWADQCFEEENENDGERYLIMALEKGSTKAMRELLFEYDTDSEKYRDLCDKILQKNHRILFDFTDYMIENEYHYDCLLCSTHFTIFKKIMNRYDEMIRISPVDILLEFKEHFLKHKTLIFFSLIKQLLDRFKTIMVENSDSLITEAITILDSYINE